MARIVLGLATSHGPMLTTPPDNWDQRVNFDRKYTQHAFKGRTYDFDGLVKLRANEGLDRQITKEKWRERHAECQRAISSLADVFAAAQPDVAVIFGNDQMEMFNDTAIPAFAAYWGETIENRIGPEEEIGMKAPGVAVAQAGRIPPEGATYPGLPSLGLRIIERLMDDSYDVTAVKKLRPGRGAIPHAYGFVYRQIMRDQVVPNVPLVSTLSIRPTSRRCGAATSSACPPFTRSRTGPTMSASPSSRSGGLTHFVIDEDVDNEVIEAIKTRKIDGLERLGEPIYQAGTSEVKNWVALMGAMAELKWTPEVTAYVPCYRSLAGTGNAMGFVHWHA